MTTAAIIVAAGRGLRAGGAIPKQFQNLLGKSVLRRTADAFLAHPRIGPVVIVINPEADALFDQACPGLRADALVTHGADSRDGSVRAGLAAIPDSCDRVLNHDGARPLVGACRLYTPYAAHQEASG